MTKVQNGKHDSICSIVADRIWEDYTKKTEPFLKEVHLFKIYSGRKCGEIDLYAMYYGKQYVLKFEIKSSNTKNNKRKAVEQLHRSDKCFRGSRIFNFYVYNSKNGPVYKWIK